MMLSNTLSKPVVIITYLLALVAIIVLINRYVNDHILSEPLTEYSAYPDKTEHAHWAKKVIDGGFILHFRHTSREKWTDVTTFDAIEILSNVDASKESFSRATCLSPRGVEEAKIIGAVFSTLDVGVSSVYSSASCRARQFANFAFGGDVVIHNSLLHRSMIRQSQHASFAQSLRELIVSTIVEPNANVVLSGHGSTLGYDGHAVIDEYNSSVRIDDREEGGFAVLEYRDGKVIVQHVFINFSQFANEAIDLPLPPPHSTLSVSQNSPINEY